MTSISEALRDNPYPGRLILLARVLGGELAAGYALTGRSESSRARRIEARDHDALVVVPVGSQGHDALRHYAAATADDQWTVYGNGVQVVEVACRLAEGAEPSQALEGLSYEPDLPIFTPRITAVVNRASHRAWFGAARRPEGERESPDITVVALGDLANGQAVLLSTYQSGGERVSTARCHLDVSTTAQDPEALLKELWAALDPRFRVAATVFTPLAGVHGSIVHA